MNSTANRIGHLGLLAIAPADEADDDKEHDREQSDPPAGPLVRNEKEPVEPRVHPAPVAQLIIDGWEEPEGQ